MERRIDYVPLDAIHVDDRNPKEHDLGLLDHSMRRFGYIEPVVVDERTDRLVSGHGRLATAVAAAAAGDDPPEGVVQAEDGSWLLPVVRGWASQDDNEAAAALVALNRTSQVGGWDDQRLFDVLDNLEDLTGVGFDDDDLDILNRFVTAVDYESGEGTDPYEEWQGMPDFDGDATAKPWRSILVHFQDEAAAQDFDRRLDGGLPVADRSMWWPRKERRRVTGLHYVSGEA